MLISAVGPGDVCTIPVLWDETNDYKDNLSVSVDVQNGDLIEMTLSMACAGTFTWSGVCRSGEVSFLATTHGLFTADNLNNPNLREDRLWSTILQSNAVQTVVMGIDHGRMPQDNSKLIPNWLKPPGSSSTLFYCITNVTLALNVIGKNY